jgi:hypothetical protein
MTLMEAVVALVILALAAVGCLELAQGASRLEFAANEWNAAISVAESRMAQASLNATSESTQEMLPVGSRDAARLEGTRVTREAWRPGLDLVSVTVPVTDGKEYVLRRLVRSARPPVGER